MDIIVTGGAGFIGSNVAGELERRGHRVTILDNLSTGTKGNLLTGKGKFQQVDITRRFSIESNVDAIIHEAAITAPRFSDDAEMLRANKEGFRNIIALALQKKAKLVYASSAGLYGNGPVPMKENQKKHLLSAYATSKLWMDEYAAQHYAEMHIVGLRYFNVFGPHEAHKGRPASMVFHLAKQMKEGKRPRIFRRGEQLRDHIYVKDAVQATILALHAKKSGVYNVGTGMGTSFNRLVEILNEVLGTCLKPEYINNPYAETYQKNTQADTTLAGEMLGFKAQYTLTQAIAEYVRDL